MTYNEIYERVKALREQIVSSTTPVEPEDVGLDDRCGPILVGEDFIATLFPRQLDYYGGFEYVILNTGAITIGTMKVYFAEGNDRVQRVLDFIAKEEDNEQ